jgi:hypothetical protein
MSTSLRGFGSYKRPLIDDLIQKFGTRSFTYREAATSTEFSHKVFSKLFVDGWVKKSEKTQPVKWQVIGQSKVCRKRVIANNGCESQEHFWHSVSSNGEGD